MTFPSAWAWIAGPRNHGSPVRFLTGLAERRDRHQPGLPHRRDARGGQLPAADLREGLPPRSSRHARPVPLADLDRRAVSYGGARKPGREAGQQRLGRWLAGPAHHRRDHGTVLLVDDARLAGGPGPMAQTAALRDRHRSLLRGLGVFSRFYFSEAIISDSKTYGTIGAVFARARAARAALNCSPMYTHSVSRSSLSAPASVPSVRVTNSRARCSSWRASVTSWTSANLATRRSGRRDISRWVATASKWLRRKPSAPAPMGPTATRTPGWAAVAAARAPASVSAAAASQAHTDEELAITVSTCRARVAGP